MAVGSSRAPIGASRSSIRASSPPTPASTPAKPGTGPFVLISITWRASSFDQAKAPRSISFSIAPLSASIRRSAIGRTSSVVASTIMYSSSMPKPSKSERTRGSSSCASRSAWVTGSVDMVESRSPAPVEPDAEPLHDASVDLVADHRVLVADLDVRIVVDLDHEELAVDLLEVDAVEPVADQSRRAHG